MQNKILITCLDLEGVLVPEIWINVAERTGIEGLRLTTRDIADYDELMQHRLKLLKQHDLRLDAIQAVINDMGPLPGARDFLDQLREHAQLLILSDTFYQFAKPLMRQLGWPSIWCHNLEIDNEGHITGYKLRQPDAKREAVRALQSIHFRVAAAGDSFNDTGMLQQAERGIFFNAPKSIMEKFPQFPLAQGYDDLLRLLTAPM